MRYDNANFVLGGSFIACALLIILGSLAACSYGARAFSGTGPAKLPTLEAGDRRDHLSEKGSFNSRDGNQYQYGPKRLTGAGDCGDPNEVFKGVRILSCYDGDTCKIEIPAYPAVFGHKLGVRLKGLDTPEIRGKCAKEKALAKEAKAFLWDLVSKAERVDLEEVSRGKYFRIVAKIVADGIDTTEALIAAGLAVRYDGGTKVKDWCK